MYFIHYNLKSIPYEFSTFETLALPSSLLLLLPRHLFVPSLSHSLFFIFLAYTCTPDFSVQIWSSLEIFSRLAFFCSFSFPLFLFILFFSGERFYLACACDIIHTYFTLLLLSLVRRFSVYVTHSLDECTAKIQTTQFSAHIHLQPPTHPSHFVNSDFEKAFVSQFLSFCSLHNF